MHCFTFCRTSRKRNPWVCFRRATTYQAENKVLDAYVNEYLLEREAQKENVSVSELLDRHTKDAAGPEPSEEALRLYYEGIESKEPFEKMRAGILDHIRQSRIAKAKPRIYKASAKKRKSSSWPRNSGRTCR